jgi:ankyrin repeat protein
VGKHGIGACLIAVCLAAAGAPVFAANAPLAKAVRKGSDTLVAKLIAAGEDVNEVDEDYRGPLYYACVRGDADLIQQLLDKGAKVNAQDRQGDTPLIALVRNTFDVGPAAALLIAHGAVVDAQDFPGRTALMEAVRRSPGVLDYRAETALVKTLLEAGADAAVQDSNGDTAAHFAAAAGEPMSMFRAVLAKTPNPHLFDHEGLDVLMTSVKNGHPAIAKLMFQAGLSPTAAPPSNAAAADPTAPDEHPRLNAYAFSWYGDYLATLRRMDDAGAAYSEAIGFFDTAIAEDARASAAIGKVLTDDQHKRDQARAGVAALQVIGIALAATTGAGFVVLPNGYAATVEADKAKLKSLQDESTTLAKKRDALKEKTGAAEPTAVLAPAADGRN